MHLVSKGQGPALVLLHGWGFDHQVWLPLAKALLAHYTLFLVDLPGFGQTPYVEWEVFKRQLRDQLPQQFNVLGWSLGGLYAMRLASELPTQVDRLMCVASSPRFTKESLWPGVDASVLKRFWQNLTGNPRQTVKQFIALQLGHSVLMSKNYTFSEEGLIQGLNTLLQWDLRAELSKYNRPGKFIFGRLDSIVPSTSMTAMQAQFPNFDYAMFTKAAHMPFLSHEDEFIDHVKRFFI